MYKEAELFTVYELYKNNDSTFPFWIKATVNSQTCMLVTGWSKYIGAKSYQGTPILTVASVVRDEPEAHTTKQEDFIETGSFVGIQFYSDKKTRTNPQQEKLLSISAGSTRSWIAA